MEHIDGKWAKQILDCRNNDGMWGNFHTLSRPISGKAYTTGAPQAANFGLYN